MKKFLFATALLFASFAFAQDRRYSLDPYPLFPSSYGYSSFSYEYRFERFSYREGYSSQPAPLYWGRTEFAPAPQVYGQPGRVGILGGRRVR